MLCEPANIVGDGVQVAVLLLVPFWVSADVQTMVVFLLPKVSVKVSVKTTLPVGCWSPLTPVSVAVKVMGWPNVAFGLFDWSGENTGVALPTGCTSAGEGLAGP